MIFALTPSLALGRDCLRIYTLHNVFALQHFADRAKADGQQLYTCFLDFKGAYDRVQRPLLWQVLQRLGVHGPMLAAVQSLYKDSGLTININGRSGKTVQSHTGVKQGCPLSPTLFGLYIDGMHRFLMSSDLVLLMCPYSPQAYQCRT